VALHNSPNRQDPDAIATPESFRAALALSKNFQLNLDIGNFTAAGFEAVAFVQENHAILSHLQLKDRTRNGARNEAFGDGDTPIADVVRLVRDKRLPIPLFVEYEYIGLGTPLEEVRRCLSFARLALS
jgi:sugar phosphate isomerase/epimerase